MLVMVSSFSINFCVNYPNGDYMLLLTDCGVYYCHTIMLHTVPIMEETRVVAVVVSVCLLDEKSLVAFLELNWAAGIRTSSC
jgi:hypothetical protein